MSADKHPDEPALLTVVGRGGIEERAVGQPAAHDPALAGVVARRARLSAWVGTADVRPERAALAARVGMLAVEVEDVELGAGDVRGKPIRQLLRSLAQRNLLRGYLLSIPTGQAMAAAMGIDPLTPAEVKQGNSLGELGSRIVVETQIGILRNVPNSYLNADDGPWDPSLGVRLDNGDPIVTIRDFFRFADLPA